MQLGSWAKYNKAETAFPNDDSSMLPSLEYLLKMSS
jgi:hypothetical protein